MESDNEMGTDTHMNSQTESEMGTEIEKAVAVLHPTQGNNVSGILVFTQTSEGIRVQAEVSGLGNNTSHGYHIHLYGDCRASDGTSAGTHFNFEGSSTNPPADIDRITGNLGDLNANQNGEATADAIISKAVFNGPKSIVGKAVIVHAKPNDPSQPPIGAAGSRLACGVIGEANPDVMMN